MRRGLLRRLASAPWCHASQDVSQESLGGLTSIIKVNDEFKAQAATREYKRVMLIQPGPNFAATAYMGPGGKFSRYQDGSITWQTFVHEICKRKCPPILAFVLPYIPRG